MNDDFDVDSFDRSVRSAYPTGYERTSSQDIGYGLRQLVDVTIRALSPSVNDPTTAVHALSHISAVLCQMLPLLLQLSSQLRLWLLLQHVLLHPHRLAL